MTKKIFFISLFIFLTSAASIAQRSIPSNLRVKVDANGYLLATGVAGQTAPITTTVFTNARLRTDANGYLLVSIVGGSTAQDAFCLDATNKDIYIARQAANSFGFYTGASNCASGTLRFLLNATGFGFGAGVPTTNIPIFKSFSVNGQVQEQLINTNVGTGNYVEYLAKANDTSVYLGVEPSNSSDTFGAARAYEIATTTSSTAGVAGKDYFACTGATPSGCFFRWLTNGASSTAIRMQLDGTALSLNNAEYIRSQSITNGQSFNGAGPQTLTELTTIAAAPNTDTTIQMPANSVVLAVSVRVTVVIPTAATFTVGDSGSATRFSTAAVSTAATSTDPGTKAGAYYNASALSVRITPNAQPADNTGRVRVVIYYYTVTPPTS